MINAVVIDNEIKDIIGVTTALSELGISTLPVHYKDPTLALELCKKVSAASPRVIITDIQLRDGAPEPTKSDLANVANCLASIVRETNGPYVVLAWTSKPEALDALRSRVEAYFDKAGIRLPMYFDRICKQECSIGDDGYSAAEILRQFQAHLAGEASVRALMHWECSVLHAATESVNTLAGLDPDTLPQNLKSLAISVAGSNLKGFEATAINEAFSYVLKDKLGLLSLTEYTQTIWNNVFSEAKGDVLETSKHQLNTILHVETAPQGTIICPGDVWISDNPQALFKQVEVKDDANNQTERMKNEFLTLKPSGHKLDMDIRSEADADVKKKLQEQFRDSCATPLKEAKKACKVAMVEISPACDFANKKKPLKTIALGLLIPADSITNEVELKQSDSTIMVKIVLDGTDYILGFSAKYITALSGKLIGSDDLKLTKMLRIRESLLQSWIHRFSAYNSRIGTISFQ